MKKVVLFILCSLSISLGALAQGKTYLGVQGGATFSTARIFNAFSVVRIEERITTGYQTGFVLMNFLQPHIGVQTGLNYMQKGWRQKFFSDEPDYTTTLEYVELPLLVNIYTGKDRLHFFANGGCFFEYLVRHELSPFPDGFDPDGDLPFEIANDEGGTDDFVPFDENRDNKWGYGLKGGVGSFYDFNFGTLMLAFNVNYNISDVFNPGDFAQGVPNGSKQLTFGLNLSYLFSLGSIE